MTHECIQESTIKHNEIEIAELKKEMDFKREKIDKLQDSVDIINIKIDKFLSRSEERDRDIELRLKAVEQTITVIKYFIPVLLTIIGLIGWKTIFG
jgi:peptidoglycan hydrolase CwlO-like protein